MTGIHDAGYGFTANLNSAIYGTFKLDERSQSETALTAGPSAPAAATNTAVAGAQCEGSGKGRGDSGDSGSVQPRRVADSS